MKSGSRQATAMVYSEKKNTLVKHSAAVHISNQITGLERKVYNVLLKNASGKLDEKEEHHISLIELVKEIGWSKNNFVPQHIRNSIIRLVETSIQWNILGRDKKRKWAVSTLLASAKISNGVLYYSYSNELKYLLSKPNVYTTLNLDYQRLLKSKYSLALWEFCCEQLDTSKARKDGLEDIDIITLRSILGAESETYSSYKVFNQLVLKPAIEEVNNSTDLEVTVTTHKRIRSNSRRISTISFQVRRKLILPMPQMELFEDAEKEVDVIDFVTRKVEFSNLIGLSVKLNIDEEHVFQYLKEYEVENVLMAFSIVLEKIKQGDTIKNVGGYIWSLLDKGIIEIQSSDKMRCKILELETQQKQEKEEESKQQIIKIIQTEQDKVRQNVLIACAEVMHPTAFLKMAGIMEIIKFNETDLEVYLSIFMNYRYSVGIEQKLEIALEEKFAVENKKIFIRIETNK